MKNKLNKCDYVEYSSWLAVDQQTHSFFANTSVSSKIPHNVFQLAKVINPFLFFNYVELFNLNFLNFLNFELFEVFNFTDV